MAQLEHRLAIVKIVPRKKLIEPDKIFPQNFQLRVVKLFEERRNRIRRQHCGQLEHLALGLTLPSSRAFCLAPARARAVEIEDITLMIRPFVGSRAAGIGPALHRDTAESRAVSAPCDHRRLLAGGDGGGVLSGISISMGVSIAICVLCHRSREIQRRMIAVSAARNRKNAKRRSVLRRNLATRPVTS